MTSAARQQIVRISGSGRLSLPVQMRRALGLTQAGEVVLIQEDDGVRIVTMPQALARVRALAEPYRPRHGLASDELVAERHAEAARESADE